MHLYVRHRWSSKQNSPRHRAGAACRPTAWAACSSSRKHRCMMGRGHTEAMRVAGRQHPASKPSHAHSAHPHPAWICVVAVLHLCQQFPVSQGFLYARPQGGLHWYRFVGRQCQPKSAAHVLENCHQLGTHVCARPFRQTRALRGDDDHSCRWAAATEHARLTVHCPG
jgi:hypothetical protein